MVDITSQMNTKIRLVRCPRCREVLPELPDIPVYKCGGCGTILEAKNRKNDIKEAVLSSHETNSSQNDEDESVSDSSNQETTPVSESSPGSEFKGDNFEIENDKQPGTSFSDEHLSSPELSSHGNKRLSPEARESMEQGEHKCPLGEDGRKDVNESLNRNVQQPEDGISSDELPNSDDLSFRKKEYSSPEIREPMMQGEDRSSLTENIGKYAKESQDDYSEQTGEKKSSDELHSSAELSCQNIETSSPKVSECIKLNGPEDLSELYPSRDQDECRDCKADKPEGNNFLAIVPLTGEGNHQSELSPGGGAHTQWDGSIYNSEKNNGESQHEFPGQIEESSQNIEFVREASSTAPDACHKVETSSVISKTHTDVNEDSVSHFKSSNLEDSLSLEKEDDVLVAVESPLNEGNISENLSADISASHLKTSHVEGSLNPEKRDVLVATESLLNEGNLSENLSPDNSVSHFETSNVEGSLSLEKGDVLVAAESPLNEANLSEYLSPDEYLEQSQKNVQGFDRVSSGESLVGLPIIPRYTPGAMSKSPTRIYYGDSSVSSYDGNEDQPSDQPSHLYKGKFKATDLLSTHRSRRTDGLRAKKMQDSELEMHHEQIASSSKFPEKNSPAIIGREWIHDELPRPRGQSSSIFAEMNNQAITGREWSHDELPHVRGQSHATRRRFDNNDLISKKPYVSRGYQLVHGNGSPSSYRHNVFHHHSGFHSPDTKSYVEPDKMELLRMVYELEDKLNKTRISEGMENKRFSSGVPGYEKHTPTRYDDLATEGNVYADFANFKYHDSFSQGIGWPQRSKVSRMAFSSETAYGRHQVDCLCSHCSPQDWQWSRQLPSHYRSHRKRQYTVHPGHHRHEAFPSHSSTPQHYTSSEFSSWDQEIKSENQKYKEHEQRRLYLREKYRAAKRHLRPTAGGAPIIACSHCSELLQLPMDFLVLRKRCHQLRCNSCYRILKFSLQKKVHLVPHVPNLSTPPSEKDDDSGVANSRTLASSHSNHHPPQAEPVSFSEDYDLSFCRSCSTEREPSMVTPASHSLQNNTHKGKMPSGDSYQSMEDRNTNAVSRNSRSTGKNSGEAFESVETSSKMSKWGTSCSEIQEVPAASGSPLHKLMGYSSPSHVLFASPGDESEEEMRYRNQHM